MKTFWLLAIVFLVGLGLFSFGISAQSQPYTMSTGGILTASGGDQTTCTLAKVAGSMPSVSANCTPGNGGPVALITIAQKTAASGATTFQVGDIVCIVGMNATAVTATLGTLSVLGSSAVFACAVNLRATPSGPVTGNAAVPQQTMTWP